MNASSIQARRKQKSLRERGYYYARTIQRAVRLAVSAATDQEKGDVGLKRHYAGILTQRREKIAAFDNVRAVPAGGTAGVLQLPAGYSIGKGKAA